MNAKLLHKYRRAKNCLTNEEYGGARGRELDKMTEELSWVQYYLSDTVNRLIELESRQNRA